MSRYGGKKEENSSFNPDRCFKKGSSGSRMEVARKLANCSFCPECNNCDRKK